MVILDFRAVEFDPRKSRVPHVEAVEVPARYPHCHHLRARKDEILVYSCLPESLGLGWVFTCDFSNQVSPRKNPLKIDGILMV